MPTDCLSRIRLTAVCLAWVAPAVCVAAAAAAAPRIEYRAELDGGVGYVVTDVAVAPDGSVWVGGTTTNHLLPVTPTAIDTQFDAGDFDEGFVLKFDAGGTLVYASYFGGRNVDDLTSLTIDALGNVYLAGTTLSDDLPTANAFQPTLASPGAEDAFLAQLDADGQLVMATYFGGNGRDLFPGGVRGNPGAAVAVTPQGDIYLAGGTGSTDLPCTGGHQETYGGGTQDAYLARFTREAGFAGCTYLGGPNNEGAYRIAVNAAGDAFLLGLATRLFGEAWAFPTTPAALLSAPAGEPVNFVARFARTGALRYATLFGPDAGDSYLAEYHGDIAADDAGVAYLVGVTTAAAFPLTPGVLQPTRRGFSDVFVSALEPDGAALRWSTLFGGAAAELAAGEPGARIAVAGEDVVIAANTESPDLPLQLPFELTRSGGFVARLTDAGSALAYASYLLPNAFGVTALVAAASGPGAPEAVFVAGTTADPAGLAVVGIGEGQASCLGDCDGDGAVSINELIRGVGIALGLSAAAECGAYDPDGDGSVTIADLIAAVGAALNGC